MKPFAVNALRASALVAFFLLTTAGVPTNGVPTNGVPTNGVPTNGVPTNGVPTNGVPTNGVPTNGVPTNGVPTNAATLDAFESSLIFANRAVHTALITKPFTRDSLTDATSAVYQVWFDPFSTLLLSYLWQDAHAAGDDLVFVAPNQTTYRFYGNLGLCDHNGTGWARNQKLDDDVPCAQWLSALIITQINQSGIHNLFSARGPSSRLDVSAIGTQLTDMSPTILSFDYKFGTRELVEALHDGCAPGTIGLENCGWHPGVIGTGTPGTRVRVAVTVGPYSALVQVNQGIMGHNHPFTAKGSCFGAPPGCTDPDLLGFTATGAVNPTVDFTIPPSGVFNVQWTSFARDDLPLVDLLPLSVRGAMTAQVVGPTGILRFPADELDIFPTKNREMTARGNIFGESNIDSQLWSCEARLAFPPPPNVAPSVSYDFTSIDVPSEGPLNTNAYGINASRAVAGTFSFGEEFHGFVRNPDGSFLQVDVPLETATSTNVWGIDDAGDVVGSFTVSDGSGSQGFVLSPNGDFAAFTAGGATEAHGINAHGQIVGSVFNDSGASGFLREPDGKITIVGPTQLTLLGAPEGISDVELWAIDSRGNMAGRFDDEGGVHGFVLLSTGKTPFTRIHLSGATGTNVYGINDAGQIVGSFTDFNEQVHGFVLNTSSLQFDEIGRVTSYLTLDGGDVSSTEAFGINVDGAIVGNVVTNVVHGFLATLPAPQLCQAGTSPCIPCTRTFTNGHVVFPNAHMWLSRGWTDAQDYYHARACSSNLSTCIAQFEGYIDQPWRNPATGRTVPACLGQGVDSDSHPPPLTYGGAPRNISDADSCFIDTGAQTDYSVTTFFPNYRDLGPCGAIGLNADPKICGYGQTSRIAFVSSRTGNGDIYLMDPDGSNPTVVAPNPAIDAHPVLSPDGTKLAFVSTRTGWGDLYLADVANPAAPPVRLAGDCSPDVHPVWSPLGDRIAFVSLRSGNGDVYVVNTDGSGLMNVSNSPAIDFDPAFSPDGTKIVFSSTRTGLGDLYLVRLGDPSLTPVRLTNSFLPEYGSVFSPDVTKETIAFVRGGDIYLLDVASTSTAPLVTGAAADLNPAFSPDGKRIAFVSTRSGNSDVWLIGVDGTGLRNLSSNSGQDFAPVFSPDGKHVAYVTSRDWNLDIESVSIDTGTSTNLTHNPAIDVAPDWR